ncbi:unnamed protein product [Linum tenue]|uniref:Response regulatory domain-containing protein n=1 Tax=Linum tenue TaxID=586396 RepID=A0AAV0RI66_9ROSI|nr:unnamed protein product [Linum tenue]
MGEAEAERSPVEMPATEDEMVKKEEAVAMDDELQKRPIHVLVVDDCSLDRRIVGKLLQKASFKVTSVESGKKAMEVLGLDIVDVHQTTTATANADSVVDDCSSTLNNDDFLLCQDDKIDLILTDYCMPEMNGYDLLVAVKKHSERQATPPIVILSSEYNPQRISSCLESGAEEFLQKPLKPKDMEKFRTYVASAAATLTRSGTKRKAVMELTSENNSNERLPRMAGVTVA